MTTPPRHQAPGRRRFLKMAGAALASGLAGPALATLPAGADGERILRLHNTHTGEQSNVTYWADGAYQQDGLAELGRLLRDHRSNEVGAMHTGLLDLLYLLSASLETQERIQVISGYRSPATNAMLHKTSSGVAARSLHMDGLAMDIRVPGRKLADVRRAAIALGGGGVGYYPASDFVHVDIGRVRTW
ncbi:DUF882 domain-containing protein [Janthinobacterium fluminis]|uniref:Murein endopeptidase K n=1 Tax=Janthinobacterium fluminis TaxID=2987524 RepID=A0ABT5K5Q0_9BURK|nr:DUF882 domain-containing protein [Janthinobacterium fluminis]MDC8759760.1 DUF882 domain-containing protein [Janthinobacterium fluminis]